MFMRVCTCIRFHTRPPRYVQDLPKRLKTSTAQIRNTNTSWGCLGESWRGLGEVWGGLRGLEGVLGGSRGGLEALLRPSWCLVG